MVKICICDLDGVVCNSSARFTKAEETKAAYLESQDWNDALENHGTAYLEQQATNLYWRTAFTPDLVQLDTLMDGANEALEQIVEDGYAILFLTSRPETMRQATVDWFWQNDVVSGSTGVVEMLDGLIMEMLDGLIMKPLSQQFVKTPVWKAGTIEVLARLLQPDDLLVIDDEHAAQLAADLAHLDVMKLTCVASLQEAVAKIG